MTDKTNNQPEEEKTEEVLALSKEEIAVTEELTEGKPTAVIEENVKKEASWKAKTELGKRVIAGEITDIDEILNKGIRILEPEIVDHLVQLDSDLLLIGQSKGKFGGGKRRIFRQTQKKTKEGNKPKFATIAVVGDRNGHVGIGFGKSKETVPSREKAIRDAKLNLFKVERGSGSWESDITEPHSIPFAVEGKCSSVTIRIMPAPKGKGLVIEKECAKILELAGIKDVWSKSRGQTKNKINMVYACQDALKKLSSTRINRFDSSNAEVAAEQAKIASDTGLSAEPEPAVKGEE